MDFDSVRVECDIVADIPDTLTAHLYDALRTFEGEFKAACCLSDQRPCSSCGLHSDCPYRIIFGQKLSPDPEIVRLHQKPSLPFSLYISEMAGNKSSCTVGMVIVGDAVNFIEFFHSALIRTVEAAVCSLLSPSAYSFRSYSLDYQAVRHPIEQHASLHESVIMLSGRHILENTLHADSVRLTFKSPLRLMSNGLIAHCFDFSSFFRSQLRRCSSLCAYYGTGELNLDFAVLSDASQNVTVLEDDIRYTQPTWSRRLNRAGLIGTAECCGLAEQMYPLLLLGSHVNAGKGATFGSGFYQIEVM